MKSPIRAAQKKQRGRMRPAGRQFDMPDLKSFFKVKSRKKNLWKSLNKMSVMLFIRLKLKLLFEKA